MDLSLSLEKYFDELSSNSPTPGGGNVAALCGALAACLGMMVCNLTIGKKKYQEVEKEIKNLKEKLTALRKKFISLGRKDNDAFEKVMDALKLPKETDEEKALRRKALESSTFNAALVPAEVIAACQEILPYLENIALKGNRNSLSDAGVAVSLIGAAAEGAYLNVLINYSSLSDKTGYRDFLAKHESVYSQLIEKTQQLLGEIILKIRT
ncbi:MAG TPA: cyclodeaminase/cyclohydrolase family protein [Ignavibacteriaceae bacterium]|nr:cyclodeaminase/cyclohydrolase family protein [Ignavibacteriaceae bacterium]